jgi:tetratricopeptide (TPR) repeat protein
LLYDDAAVACERLDRGDEGMDWLEKKHGALKRLDPDGARKDDWYRYYANVGTLRVHRWARNGMNQEDIAELEQAIKEIESAIKINPDAHFGREWVQLGLMKAIAAHLTDGPEAAEEEIASMREGKTPEELREGLLGLITLGAAWESPDVYMALHGLGNFRRDQSIATTIRLRIAELEDAGTYSVFGDQAHKVLSYFEAGGSVGQTGEDLKVAFQALRKNADEYAAARTDYMLTRLNAGRHPDTDQAFWDEYVETERINLRQFEPLVPRKLYMSPMAMLVGGIAVCSSPFITLFIVLNRRKKFKAGRAESSKLPPGA